MIDLVPSEFYLSQNYPNPFCKKTAIKFCVAYKTKVTLEIFDSEGKMIKKLLDEEKEAGTYEVSWNAESSSSGVSAKGRRLDSSSGHAYGVYFCQLKAGSYVETRKMLMMK
jgi:hypothetical protein